MKKLFSVVLFLSLGATSHSFAQQHPNYTNFIRQIQVVAGSNDSGEATERDVPVDYKSPEGGLSSELSIRPGGADFELWTVRADPLRSFLLAQQYVGTIIPVVDIEITSADPYPTIPRTRCDKPFTVTVSVSEMDPDPSSQEAARNVDCFRYEQQYEAGSDGSDVNQADDTFVESFTITSNDIHTYKFDITALGDAGDDFTKLRGEERFVVRSLVDNTNPEHPVPSKILASQQVQVWPMADARIDGIDNGMTLRFDTPVITLTYNDLYPDSNTEAVVYPGAFSETAEGRSVPESSANHYSAVPLNTTRVLNSWDKVIDRSGEWTMEIRTSTPWGTETLAYKSFSVDRDIEVNGTVTTVE